MTNSKAMKKVLIIDEGFPGTGGSRTVKFVKYLPQFGWEPLILTIDQMEQNPFAKEILKNHTHPSLEIYGTKTLPNFSALKKFNLERVGGILNSFFLIPDITIAWILHAVIKGVKVIQKENPQIIYSTSPSESVHLIAYFLKKKMRLPWVADFRDLWTLFQGRYRPISFFHHIINRYLEKSIYLKWSDIIIANTEENKRIIVDHFQADPNKIEVITNGFDPDEVLVEKCQKREDKMVLGYFGSLEKPMYSFKEFLPGYEKAIRSERRFSLKVWTVLSNKLKQDYRKNPMLYHHITFNNYISHQTSMRELGVADVLVVLLKRSYPHVVPQKLYNYLSLKKPILAIVPPDGCAAKVIRHTSSGMVVSPDNVDGITYGLLELHEKWKKGLLNIQVSEKALQKYRTDKLTKKLSKTFNTLIEKT